MGLLVQAWAMIADASLVQGLQARRREEGINTMPLEHDDIRVREPIESGDPGSEIRTHLALERTFLAWFRTGIALIALGLAAAQFLERSVVPGFPLHRLLALTVVLSGAALVAISAHRYHESVRQLGAPVIRTAWREVAVTTVFFLIITVFAIIFIWSLS